MSNPASCPKMQLSMLMMITGLCVCVCVCVRERERGNWGFGCLTTARVLQHNFFFPFKSMDDWLLLLVLLGFYLYIYTGAFSMIIFGIFLVCGSIEIGQ